MKTSQLFGVAFTIKKRKSKGWRDQRVRHGYDQQGARADRSEAPGQDRKLGYRARWPEATRTGSK